MKLAGVAVLGLRQPQNLVLCVPFPIVAKGQDHPPINVGFAVDPPQDLGYEVVTVVILSVQTTTPQNGQVLQKGRIVDMLQWGILGVFPEAARKAQKIQ